MSQNGSDTFQAILDDIPAAARDQIVPIVDFGSQYVQLIARRVREAGVYSVMVGPNITHEQLKALRPKGIILSGGPSSVYEEGAPTCDPDLFDLGVPVLGICYGMQIGTTLLGATVKNAPAREYGRVKLSVDDSAELTAGVPTQTTAWMSHGDQIAELPKEFVPLATTPTCPYAAVRHTDKPFYGVQFHPEVTHTPHGKDLLHNFLYKICGCTGNWRMADFLKSETERIREIVGDKRVICGLSGGVDSSVVAAMLAQAIGDQLTCVFVDNGLLRKGEREMVENMFNGHFNIDLRVVDASKAFLDDLAGITEPQEKRKRIGHRFIEVFKEASADIEGVEFLAQGTLYPDVIESGHGYSGEAANIKLHHNVGGLPAELGFKLIEPLRALFKDEVRKLGQVLGLTEEMVWRHPFPGPGLAVRCLGEVNKSQLDILREADTILLEEIVTNNLYRKTSQVFAVILPVKAVGVMGDGRTHEQVIAIRAVETQDFMTADWARIPYDILATISNRIINEVPGINRVCYDISSKPPATIEWE
ncbi:glutamine-hydrolyzing GMP synthase [Planctomycetota bacterium]|nr:glutamine-hydrolyzing GMP synthase [Planctomycetota bacterium]